MAMSDKYFKVVKEWQKPTCSKHVKRLMVLTNYHRGLIKGFSELAELLYRVIGKNKFCWGNDQENSFCLLKKSILEPPVLALPNQKDTFILDTDASGVAIGAELIQVQNG